MARSSKDFDPEHDYTNREIEQLMMPETYRPRKHRDRRMPQRKPRLNAVWTSESKGYNA